LVVAAGAEAVVVVTAGVVAGWVVLLAEPRPPNKLGVAAGAVVVDGVEAEVVAALEPAPKPPNKFVVEAVGGAVVLGVGTLVDGVGVLLNRLLVFPGADVVGFGPKRLLGAAPGAGVFWPKRPTLGGADEVVVEL
jgi:hypothetical protein